jgi:hypothetical protein
LSPRKWVRRRSGGNTTLVSAAAFSKLRSKSECYRSPALLPLRAHEHLSVRTKLRRSTFFPSDEMNGRQFSHDLADHDKQTAGHPDEQIDEGPKAIRKTDICGILALFHLRKPS